MLEIEIEWNEIRWEPLLVSMVGVTVGRVIFHMFYGINEEHKKSLEIQRVYEWLEEVTSPQNVLMNWRSTRAIASYNNLTLDRVRHLCNHHEGIVQHHTEKELWGIKGIVKNEGVKVNETQ